MRRIGVDIGTSTISLIVTKEDSEQVDRSYVINNNSFLVGSNGWERIQDPEYIIRQAILRLDEIIDSYPNIQVIGLTGQMHGIVYVSKNGKHVSPLYTWQDNRGNIPCIKDGIKQYSLCEFIREKYGKKVFSGYGLVTHLYNKKHDLVPEEAAYVCTIMDYLGMILANRQVPIMHASNAASLGFYNTQDWKFDKLIFQELGIEKDILPEVVKDYRIIGEYRKIPVCIAIGDNQASFIGSVKNMSNDILINVGTGSQISVYSDVFFECENIETRPLYDDKYILVGSAICGGRAYAVLADFFDQYLQAAGIGTVDTYDVLEKILINREEKGSTLMVNTSFAGTREQPELRGSISNIGCDNFTPAEVSYGVLNGIAEELYQMYIKIHAGTLCTNNAIIASGNCIRKNLMLQKIFAKKFGCPIHMADNQEEAAYGATIAGSKAIEKNSRYE